MKKKDYLKIARAEMIINAYENGSPISGCLFNNSKNHSFETNDYSKLEAYSENAEKYSQEQHNGYQLLAAQVTELQAKLNKQEKQYKQLVATIEKKEKKLRNDCEREIHQLKKKSKSRHQKVLDVAQKIEKRTDDQEWILLKLIGMVVGKPFAVDSLKAANKVLERKAMFYLPKSDE